ncbi:hypothetical protein [Dongshaea marina]|uniref:hypothetical protein n=1 Tax=Dongshaea marina TaxID=2047966 RepID=UPI00131F1EDE|nr:hypothetical protein [Dongshaea marina]
MKESRYIFMVKDNVTMAQSLDDHDAGDIVISLLHQGFTVSPYQVNAVDGKKALSIMESQRVSKPHQTSNYPWFGITPYAIANYYE